MLLQHERSIPITLGGDYPIATRLELFWVFPYKLDGALNVITEALAARLGFYPQLQVFWSVITANTVNVVDILFAAKWPTEFTLHHYPVDLDIFPVRPLYDMVPLAVDMPCWQVTRSTFTFMMLGEGIAETLDRMVFLINVPTTELTIGGYVSTASECSTTTFTYISWC